MKNIVSNAPRVFLASALAALCAGAFAQSELPEKNGIWSIFVAQGSEIIPAGEVFDIDVVGDSIYTAGRNSDVAVPLLPHFAVVDRESGVADPRFARLSARGENPYRIVADGADGYFILGRMLLQHEDSGTTGTTPFDGVRLLHLRSDRTARTTATFPAEGNPPLVLAMGTDGFVYVGRDADLRRYDAATDERDEAFPATPLDADTTTASTWHGGRLYLAGAFRDDEGTTRTLLRVDPSTGARMYYSAIPADFLVRSIGVSPVRDHLYFSGNGDLATARRGDGPGINFGAVDLAKDTLTPWELSSNQPWLPSQVVPLADGGVAVLGADRDSAGTNIGDLARIDGVTGLVDPAAASSQSESSTQSAIHLDPTDGALLYGWRFVTARDPETFIVDRLITRFGQTASSEARSVAGIAATTDTIAMVGFWTHAGGAGIGGDIAIFDAMTGRAIGGAIDMPGAIRNIAVASDGERVFAMVQDATTGLLPHRLRAYDRDLQNILFDYPTRRLTNVLEVSPDNQWLYFGAVNEIETPAGTTATLALNRISLSDGALDETFRAMEPFEAGGRTVAAREADTLAFIDGGDTLVFGGRFVPRAGGPVRYVVSIDAASGLEIAGGDFGAQAQETLALLAAPNGVLYFSGGIASGITAIDLSTREPLPGFASPITAQFLAWNDARQQLLAFSTQLNVPGATCQFLFYAMDPLTGELLPWCPLPNRTQVQDMETFGGSIYVGGSFTEFGTEQSGYIPAAALAQFGPTFAERLLSLLALLTVSAEPAFGALDANGDGVIDAADFGGVV